MSLIQKIEAITNFLSNTSKVNFKNKKENPKEGAVRV